MEREMSEKTGISRRQFLRLALMGIGAGLIGKPLYDLGKLYLSENSPPEGVDENFVLPEITNMAPTKTATPEATHAPQNTQTVEPTQTAQPTETPTTTPEVKPPVDQYKIKEKIDLASREPMKWLFVLPGNKAILTPMARPYAYSPENNTADIFNWRNHTTYTYLENHNTPILWGHEGIPELFFDTLAEYLRKPDGTLATRNEAAAAMNQNLIGAKVFLMQAADESYLPANVENVNLKDQNVRVAEMTVTAGLLVPRFQKINPEGHVTFDGSGKTTDWVANWYEKHTMDMYHAIEEAYPDTELDPNLTHRRFLNLPTPETLGVKFCIKKFSDDPACSTDANGETVIPASYGRVFLALKTTE